MRRLAENVIFQKFRRHEIDERFEKTTRPGGFGQDGENAKLAGEPIEYSRHSTSRDEYSEERYFTKGGASLDQNIKKLHYTQSLQDTFSPPSPIAASNKFSKEFPPIQRENSEKFEPVYNRPVKMPPAIPIMREEQKQEICEEDKGENFLRRQQHKLYQLREETIRKFGHHNGPQGQPQNADNEQQRRARLHGSLPPLGRQKQFYSPHQYQQQIQQMHQQAFELVLDRYPPQMVHSISFQSPPDPSLGEKRDERAGSCGFSPFPVFGPFAVTTMSSSAKLAPKSAFDAQWDEWKIHHQQQESREENYENTKNIPIAMETTTTTQTTTTNKLSTSMVSGDECWQSAYEYLPQQKQTSPFPVQSLEQQQSQYHSAQQLYKSELGQKAEQSEENIEHTFHLYKFGQNPSLAADKNAIKFSATSSARGHFMAPLYPKPWFQQPKMPAQLTTSMMSAAGQTAKAIEISTFSERQANEEVRAITHHGGTQSSLNNSMSKSGESAGGPAPREGQGQTPREIVGLPDRVHYHGQPIKVEISGPVHFLHATNMSVTQNSGGAKPSDSVQSSMTSSVGIPLAPESPQGKFAPGRQQSPTKWTQTEWEGSNEPKQNQRTEHKEKHVQIKQQGQTRTNVISPPVERFIDSVCDIKPILAEIGRSLKEQGEMISPIGNFQTIRRRHEKETKREKHLKYTEKCTEYKYQIEGDQQRPQPPRMRISQSEATLGSAGANAAAAGSKANAGGGKQPRRPSMTSSTVDTLSAIWSPYLVESTSHCHLARVTEITQEWRIQQQHNRPFGAEAKCACAVTPNYNREFGRAQFWTMAIPIERNNKSKYSTQRAANVGQFQRESPAKSHQNVEQQQKYSAADQFATLQTLTKRRRSQQQEYMEMLHKSRSLDQDEMPRLIGHEQYENLRRTLNEVQKDLDNAKEYTRKSRNADVKRIEQAILMISERIQRPQEPVSKAQAEAKEELLRVRLAQMILNLDPDFEPIGNGDVNGSEMARIPMPEGSIRRRRGSNVSAASSAEVPLDDYYGNALRAPIGLLREKLTLLERRLMDEQQLEIADQLRQINATPPLRRTQSQKRRQEALAQRNEEIARMTPLIGMLRHKLGALDAVCRREQRKVVTSNGSGRLTPYEDRKTVHELLVRINKEIEIIHELCRKEDVKDRLDTVLLILKKVANSIDKIMETLDSMSTNANAAGSTVSPANLGGKNEQILKNVPQHHLAPSAVSSKLEAAIHNRQNESPTGRKQRVQQMGRAEMLLGGGMRRSHSPIDIEKYSNERRPQDPVQREQFDPHLQQLSSIYQQQQPEYAQSNQYQQQHESGNKKGAPPQVPPKRKSLTTSIDERRGSLYSIVEEKEPMAGMGSQQKRPPNLGEMSASMGEKGGNRKEKAALTKQRSRSQTPPPPPRIVRQMQQQSSMGDQDGPVPFRLGPCPISYLERDRQMQAQEQRQRLQQNSLWGNGGRSTQIGAQNYLQPPSRKSSQQQKFLQLQQQHQIFSSLEDDEEDESVSVSAASSAMDTSSLSVPILFHKKSSICSAPPAANIRPSAAGEQPAETAILTDEVNEREENCTETFFLRRRRKHAILNAIIYPEQKARVRAEFCGNTFEVDVERMTECGRDSVVMVSEEFYDKKVLIRSGSPVRHTTIMEEMGRESSSEENTSRNSPGFVDAHTRMAVSINAKSDYDSVHVFLEEIPWGQIGLDVKETPVVSPAATTTSVLEDQRSARSLGMASSVDSTLTVGRESVLKQISVSEGVGGLGDELSGRLSLRSASRRSSQKSLAHSERSGATTFLIGGQEEELEDIPAYVIKSGSTASITCELNSDCVEEGTKIEWFRGQNEQILAMGGKFERHTQDCVEILVIYDVRPEDGQLYSVKINGELFPVAYLIIEDLDEAMGEEMSSSTPSGQTVLLAGPSAQPQFLTAPQTQFVMQGETAIISVSMNRANLNVIWSKDGQQLDGQNGEKTKDGRPRIWLESTTTGWYRVIVNEVQFSDQGYYYAQIGDKFTNVQLIVEDRIDEREVQVSSAETDDEELGDYLVPIGSTATIACELENVSFGYRLHWQRDHRDLDARIASGDGKFEHVVNGTKHYLIIHCAQPCDSGVYSVRIGDAKFKVAQITISNEQQLSGSAGGGSASRVKRISSQSLEKIEEKEQQQPSPKSGKRKGVSRNDGK